MIPTLATERLLLRPPETADFELYAAFFASDRASWEDGPLSRQDAWAEFATAASGWVLRGFGSLSIADRGYVLSHGEIVLSDRAKVLQGDRELLISSYLGEQQVPIGETGTGQIASATDSGRQ